MTAVFAPPEAHDCRFCGASHIPASKRHGLCKGCHAEYERWKERAEALESDNSLNRWMARRLMLEADRLSKTGMIGRCEAISGHSRGWLDGHDAQCRMRAITLRDGRQVCAKHAAATSPYFVGEVRHDPYQDFARVLASLARVDAKFRDAVIAALRTDDAIENKQLATID